MITLYMLEPLWKGLDFTLYRGRQERQPTRNGANRGP
jgi:hypothetical protein